jgi:hypothetical protein
MGCWTSGFSTLKMGGSPDGGVDSATAGDPPVAVPFGDKHTTDREPTEARFRRVLSWARQQAAPAGDTEGRDAVGAGAPPEDGAVVQVAIEKAEIAPPGRWMLWNPSLTLLMLLTLPVKLYKRRQADRFDNSRRSKILPEAVADELDLPVAGVDLSYPERYRRQGWVVTLWAWVPVAVAVAAGASLGWGWAALLGACAAVFAGVWSHRRHSRLRERHMAEEIAALTADGSVVFFVGDSHVNPICKRLNEVGVATARHPDSRYATATVAGPGEGSRPGGERAPD